MEQASRIALAIDAAVIERIVDELVALRARGGRLFILGVGGSAANCSHAVNDFRKLANIEAYAPTDNVAELTARANDDGFDTIFEAWLKTSHADKDDAVLVLSVGGGDEARHVSTNLVRAIDEAHRRGMQVYGIVGRPEGYTARMADAVVLVPVEDVAQLTPHAEAFQAVVWHAMVCHPALLARSNKWESLQTTQDQQP
jgi:D-sedoheptulose 7-phosphate isomerase